MNKFKLVPVEPTRAMIDAARDQHEGEPYLPVSLYKAMLAAAPDVQEEPVAWQCVWPGGGEFTTSSYESAKNYREGAVNAHGEDQAPCIRPLYAAPQPAEQQPVKAQPGWYCAHCQRGVDAREVTYSKQHEVCGRYIANDDPPPPSALGGVRCGECRGTGEVCTGTIDGTPELFDCDRCGGTGNSLAQQPAAAGEEIMVNTPYDVFTLPLQPSGLLSGPRFVVHVPGAEQPAAPDVARLVEALERVMYCNEVGFLPESVQQAISDALAAHRKGGRQMTRKARRAEGET